MCDCGGTKYAMSATASVLQYRTCNNELNLFRTFKNKNSTNYAGLSKQMVSASSC